MSLTTIRYRISHTTKITYDAPVASSHNEVRMTPLTESGQTALENRIRVKPMTWSHVYRDYWGTHVTSLEALEPHRLLEVESNSTVERTLIPDVSERLTWADYELETLKDSYDEYLSPSARTHLEPEVQREFRDAVAGMSPGEAVATICALVNERMTYMSGSTSVGDDAQTAWDARQGVCQDFTHVTLAALRIVKVPARYVSGYLCPKQDLNVGETATGESHSWVEWWAGHWTGVDPTNLREVGLDHVVVARGRDYDDVPPMKGVYQGRSDSKLTVAVSFTRLV